MELLQQAWHKFFVEVDDPVMLLLVTAVFVWMAVRATQDNNAPVRDWEWDDYR